MNEVENERKAKSSPNNFTTMMKLFYVGIGSG